jgi:hypothetical protein
VVASRLDWIECDWDCTPSPSLLAAPSNGPVSPSASLECKHRQKIPLRLSPWLVAIERGFVLWTVVLLTFFVIVGGWWLLWGHSISSTLDHIGGWR